ncbi:MAG TPA: hypothetical protein VG370_16950 [Chloroflexota bacterium]|jgi:capsular polysaccharide biosynthesis protein|nr:hypothetical protein [Chloroflexota bacterium]
MQNQYVQIALRWWWLLLLGLVLGAGGGVAYVKRGPVPYVSTAQVMVPPKIDPIGDTLGSTGAIRDAASTYIGQAASNQMFTLVSRALGGRLGARPVTATDLADRVRDKQLEVKTERGTNFMSITVTDSDPEAARRLANTYADTLVNDVNKRAAETVAARKTQLETQIELARQQLATSQLHSREQELVREIRDQRTQLLMIQTNYQQELERQERQATVDRLAAAQTTGQPSLIPVPDKQRQDEINRAGAETLRVLTEQQKDLQEIVANLSAQLDDVRKQIARAPAQQLRDRETDLAKELQTQRGLLLENNMRYQQALQGQALAGQKLTPEQEKQLQELSGATLKVRTQWIQVIGEQQKDVENNIADLTQQLKEVRDALAQLPGNSDPSLASAFAAAYSQQLLALTQEYTRVQMNTQSTQATLERYGEASEPVPAMTVKKALPMGAGAGLALGAGLAFLLDTLLRQRRARREASAAAAVADRLEASALDPTEARRVAVNGAHPVAALRRAGRYPHSRPFRDR